MERALAGLGMTRFRNLWAVVSAILLACCVVSLLATSAGAPTKATSAATYSYDRPGVALSGARLGVPLDTGSALVGEARTGFAVPSIETPRTSTTPVASGVAPRTAALACSFSSETEVVMADGTTKPISEVEVGDEVLAVDPETGQRGARRVLNLFVHDDTLVDLGIDGDVVTTTEDHPFWNHTDQAFQRADALDAGDLVLTADGGLVAVDGLVAGTEQIGTAYNLHIEEIHTYFVVVGDDEALVHNSCGPKPFFNRHGQFTNGTYSVDAAGMAPHQTGSLAGGRSQWLSSVDAETAVLDAAWRADQAGLWVGNKAKVPVFNGNVGSIGRTGELTNWITVHRNSNGFVHGHPAAAP